MKNKLSIVDDIIQSAKKRWGTPKLIMVISGALASAGITTLVLVNTIPDDPDDILEEKEND